MLLVDSLVIDCICMVCVCTTKKIEAVHHPEITQFWHFIRTNERIFSNGSVALSSELHYNCKIKQARRLLRVSAKSAK